MTAPWSRERVAHEFAIRTLSVVGVRDLTPRMRRVSLAGPDVASVRALGPTDHVKVFFPDPATGELHVPTVVDGRLVRPEGPVHFRDFTVRAVRGLELDLDFVRHDAPGLAGRWIETVALGSQVCIAGPKSSKLLPEITSALLLADETGLPALERWLTLLPDTVDVRAYVECEDRGDEAYLDHVAERPRLELCFRHRHGQPAGSTELLADAIGRRGLVDATTYVWAGAEATSLVPVRRHLRGLGLAPAQLDITGYWRRGVADHDHHAEIA